MDGSESKVVGVVGVVGVFEALGPTTEVLQDPCPEISGVLTELSPQQRAAQTQKMASKRGSRKKCKEKEISSLKDSLSVFFETSTAHRARKPPGSYASLQAGRESDTSKDNMLPSSSRRRSTWSKIAPRPTEKDSLQGPTACTSLHSAENCFFRKPRKKLSPKILASRSEAANKGWKKRRLGDAYKVGEVKMLPVAPPMVSPFVSLMAPTMMSPVAPPIVSTALLLVAPPVVSHQQTDVDMSPVATQQQVLPNINTLAHIPTTGHVEDFQDWKLNQDNTVSSQKHGTYGFTTVGSYDYGQNDSYNYQPIYDGPSTGPVYHQQQPVPTHGQLYGYSSYLSPATYPDTANYFDLDTNRGNMNLDRLLWDLAVSSSQYNQTTRCWELGTAAASLTTYFSLHDRMMENQRENRQQFVCETFSGQPLPFIPNVTNIGNGESFVGLSDQIKQHQSHPSFFENSQ